MKRVSKLVLGIFVSGITLYYLSMFVMPSLTVVNNSGAPIKRFEVTLPSNHLDFGHLSGSQQNTLHYSMTQSDGSYHYQFSTENNSVYHGQCGYVTNNEIHKRVVITLHKNNQVSCD